MGFSLSVSFGWTFTIDLTPLLIEYWPLALILLAGYGVYRYARREGNG